MNSLKKVFVVLSLFLAFTVFAPSALAQHTAPNPVIWKTNYAKFSASDFYIRNGNQYFHTVEPVQVHSDPGPKLTTLELRWTENGIGMSANMYFRMKDQNEWELYDLRASNGKANSDWNYYSVIDTLGNPVTSIPGYHNFVAERRFKPKSDVDAEIYCKDCSFTAFSTDPLKYSSHGYALEVLSGLPANETITVSNSGNTGYGVNALLRNTNREIVTDQRDFRYEWLVQNSTIARVEAGNIEYAQGGCAYDIQAPCPNMNGQIAGLNPGVTSVIVNVYRDNTVIASNSFDVKVVSNVGGQPSPSSSIRPSSTPYPSSSVRPSSSPTASAVPGGDDEQLKKELEALKGTVGEIQLDIDRQQNDLNAIQKVVKSISDFLSKLFRFGR